MLSKRSAVDRPGAGDRIEEALHYLQRLTELTEPESDNRVACAMAAALITGASVSAGAFPDRTRDTLDLAGEWIEEVEYREPDSSD